MASKNSNIIQQRKATVAKLEKRGLIPKLNRVNLYRIDAGFDYADVPDGAGPPFRRKKLAAYRASLRNREI